MTQTQCARFDFTIPQFHKDGFEFTADMIKDLMGEYCKQWVFQLEKSDTGYLHFQGRCTLIKKRREKEIGAIWNSALPHPGVHLTTTSNPCFAKGDFSYVMKGDTRLSGPWKDVDQKAAVKFLNRKLQTFLANDAYPWQKQLVKMVKKDPDSRTVVCIIDPVGCNGKSTICDYLEYKDLAKCLTPMNNMEDLMQAVFNVGAHNCFLMDMPKCTPKDKLGGLYAGIEKIKDGFAYDKRYTYKELRFMEPHVFVFTNKWPDLHLLSVDRWELYYVMDNELVRLMLPKEHKVVDEKKWLAEHFAGQYERLVIPEKLEEGASL